MLLRQRVNGWASAAGFLTANLSILTISAMQPESS
jgi:hypothetical protein